VIVPWIPRTEETQDQEKEQLVVVPMIVGDHPIGVTCLSTLRRPADFSDRDLKLLSFAISHAAVAVQNALQAREISTTRDFLSNLLDNAGDIIFSLDHYGRFTFVNPRIEELGYRKEDLLDKHFKTVFTQKEAEMRISSTLKKGVKQVFELAISGAGGLTQRYTLNLVPLKSTDGTRDGALGIMHNITELHRLQKKLLESERLAAYTQTVITLNHEINNPLTTVMGNVYLLEKETGKKKDKNLAKRLKIIQDNCRRIQHVIQKMEKINELKTVTYLGDTKMVDLGKGDADDQGD
jgi:PAS domain S-box-containing protein